MGPQATSRSDAIARSGSAAPFPTRVFTVDSRLTKMGMRDPTQHRWRK
jgi:hypothetical protein